MIATFPIEGRLSGLNDITRENRFNRFRGGRQKEREQRRVEQAIGLSRVKHFSGPVIVHFNWFEPNKRRDPDNIRVGAKVILDAMVKMQVIASDGFEWVKVLSDSFFVDSRKPRIEVSISDWS